MHSSSGEVSVREVGVPGSTSILTIVIDQKTAKTKASFLAHSWNIHWYSDPSSDNYST